MYTPFRIAGDTYVLPSTLTIPGKGLLYMNSAVILGKEPVLVDAGAAVLRDEYLDAVFALVDPADVRWVYVSHDDRDHSGNLMQLLERCQNARLVVNFQCATRLGKEWALPTGRLVFVNEGEAFDAGGRLLAPIRPPIFDSPATRGLWDAHSEVFFSIDSFGAVVPAHCENAWEIESTAYTRGFNWWNLANTPWYALADMTKMAREVKRVLDLRPRTVVPYHGPVVRGRIDVLGEKLLAIPTDEPPVFPGQDDFNAMSAPAEPGWREACHASPG